ncbi:MAG: histidinol phosphate phosphatase domain-containing protein [Desulfarculales bacterium]|jgi:histidinol phosphatase-like PHP family hydrolase|nr:histidinol phosphate phosphatase domain-containing protein [Desulfarculales bacterium]
MIDLHTHSLFSDGALLPAELIQRAQCAGYRGLAITDHADQSNLELVLNNLLPAVREINQARKMRTLVGVELTHLPPGQIASLAARARALGAQIVLVHGETLSEPVAPGTNRAAIAARVDILAHPGLLTLEEARLAAQNGVMLEISARAGHCLGNGLVASLARQSGAGLVLNSDSHGPGDLLSLGRAVNIAGGAGLSSDEIEKMRENSFLLWQRGLALSGQN